MRSDRSAVNEPAPIPSRDTGIPVISGKCEKGRKTLGELLSGAKGFLEVLGKLEGGASAERLLEHLTGYEKSKLYLQWNAPVTRALAERYRKLVDKRGLGVPTAYLTGRAFFREETLEVGRDCLIPRPETELLVEKFIENSGYDEGDRFFFLDLGTGSGAIGISVLRHFKKSEGVCSDISEPALEIAGRNIERYGLGDRAELVCSDLFERLAIRFPGRRWDAILSNPPYLSAEDLEHLQKEVQYEPRMALSGGRDGFDFYRRIIPEAREYLVPGGWLAMETGWRQAAQVARWLEEHGYRGVRIEKDLAGIERVVMGKKD